MSTYVVLMNLTEQGVKDIREAPKQIARAIQRLQAEGGELIDFYTVMGQYDYVAIVEAPGDQVALAQLLELGVQGNVRTTTLKAFSQEELAQIIKKLS